MSWWKSLPWTDRPQRPVHPGRITFRHTKLETVKPLKAGKRTLTLPLPQTASKRQRTAPQSQSLLLSKLLYETRAQIWEHAVGGMTFILQLESGHLTQSDPFFGWEPKVGLLSLLLACRQSYSEAVNILYTSNTFSFDWPTTILCLDRVLLPQRLHAIRDIRFAYWVGRLPEPDTPKFREYISVWQSLASLCGLERLRVELEGPGADGVDREWIANEARMLEPIAIIKYPK